MALKPVGILADPIEAHEAKGVVIYRTIGSERLALLDPFLLLDHLNVAPEDLQEPLGFPRHPHRGIETLTYVFRGRVEHKDSLGNEDSVGASESQWMTAGKGIFHAEMLQPDPQGCEMLQLWFNLPADQKFKPAAYQAAKGNQIPELALGEGATARVVAGTLNGVEGAFRGIAVNPLVLDVHVEAGASFHLPALAGASTVAYAVEGSLQFGGKVVPARKLAVFADGEDVEGTAVEATRFLFVSAMPLQQPVMQYRSLVLNTVDQMKDALDDLDADRFA